MDFYYELMLRKDPFSLAKKEKQVILSERLIDLSQKHYNFCEAYKRIVDAFGIDINKITSYYELPFLPVRLFKELDLLSVPAESIVKTITSSGTSNQKVSKIYVDKKTAEYQQKVLVKLVSSFTGKKRMPMLIIDCPAVIKDRDKFSARGAGILGFSILGRDKIYALDDEMRLDVEGIRLFLDRHKDESILIFGFTFMIWQHFYKELLRLKQDKIKLNLSNGILIHGGGWKKLESEAVSKKEFQECLYQECGLHYV